MLYKITFFGEEGLSKPTFMVVAKSMEHAIKAARVGLSEHEKHYEARWASTESHVDLISFEGFENEKV